MQQVDVASGPSTFADVSAAVDTVPAADTASPGAPAGAPCDEDAACQAGWCLPTAAGFVCPATCSTQACAPDRECTLLTHPDGIVGRLCVDRFAPLCLPCRTHGDCNLLADGFSANRCLDFGDAGRFCGVACGAGRPPCPSGHSCAADGQCRPDAGACEGCSPLGVALGASTPCHDPAGGTACPGTRACTADGLTPCAAPPATAEICDALDNNCDGATDEDPRALCAGFACAGADGCRTTCASAADCAEGFACDPATATCTSDGADGTACSLPEDCHSGHCANGYCCSVADAVCCAADAHCAALAGPPICTSQTASGCAGHQVVGRCVDAACTPTVVDSPAGCVDTQCAAGRCVGLTFAVPSRCAFDGACVPAAADVSCDDGAPCTLDSCASHQGCLNAPRTGASGASCYSHDPATRGVGACHDGVLYCAAGAPSSCAADQGPVAERCDGVDNDCDGATDDDTDAFCAPYRCGGASGCRTSCVTAADCAAGSFCDPAGHCQSAGLPGSPCATPSQCLSGHCDHNVCCATGTCCTTASDCDAFDASACSTASPLGCVGTRTEGVCDPTLHQCGSATVLDPTGCAGSPCAAPNCVSTVRFPGGHCDVVGSCVADAAPSDCQPYLCAEGACTVSCETHNDCAVGSSCGPSGHCKPSIPNGGACTSSLQCVSGYCANGFCCAGGACCAAASDCAALNQQPVCDLGASCTGHQVVGVCGSNKQCGAQTVSAASACSGVSCGESSCVNLTGLEVIFEGVKRKQCNAVGACVEVQRDCRDLGGTAFCTKNSTFYSWCANCSPERDTCVALDGACACE